MSHSITWHTVTDAAQILGVSRSTIQRRIQKGKIESKRENGHRLVAVPIERRSDTDMGQLSLIGQLLSEVQHLQDELKRKDAQVQRQKWASFWHR